MSSAVVTGPNAAGDGVIGAATGHQPGEGRCVGVSHCAE